MDMQALSRIFDEEVSGKHMEYGRSQRATLAALSVVQYESTRIRRVVIFENLYREWTLTAVRGHYDNKSIQNCGTNTLNDMDPYLLVRFCAVCRMVEYELVGFEGAFSH
jgi:hypothetical protein